MAKKPSSTRPYRILSFDGGGIAGLFSSTLLERIIAQRPNLVSRAHLLAGTSTGGIIALSLAADIDPEAISALYAKRGKDIFKDSFLDNVRDIGTLIGADYSHTGLKRALTDTFADLTLGDLRKKVLVPAFDLDAEETPTRPRMWKPKFFHNYPGNDSDAHERVVDVAIRTSSAPTYFPSYQGYIDGGVVANNPVMSAVAQALDARAARKSCDQIVALSVGTGLEPKFIKGKRHDWGWGQWARPLVSLMIHGVMGVADYQCQAILGERYHRLNHTMTKATTLDDIREKTLDFLVESAHDVDLAPTLQWLDTHW